MGLPSHVAIIMDGNGRWSKIHSLSTIEGHRKGAERAEEIVKYALEKGISYLTLYAFSSENWLRDKQWISDFMGLLRWYLTKSLSKFDKWNVRIRFIGSFYLFDQDIQDLVRTIEKKTYHNKAMTILVALGYGARDEITRSIYKIASKIEKGQLTIQDISQKVISEHLDTQGIPDPDLLIRTSGEQRLSNFLLWQIAYTEFIFLSVLWPDFSIDHFQSALEEFQKRKRRYGA